ncbi:hypothetical protein BUALT_Bualt15G0065800 [Buddleja alternifolia]|uniref:RING-type E3 ubiquitin transferase n=1 Tax=Buddleja alternifolia TaxID=168488 RepID=A0AAV6WJR4_9LAMI|nr:hypothetical protein BUALT_Bualt15G0065800 [Buddleja alternifolia]
MAFHHRKLLDDPDTDHPSITEFCSTSCDPEKIPDGICPPDCVNLCYIDCTPPLPQDPPPPPPPSHHEPQKLSLYLAVPLAVLAVVFFLFTCYTIYKFYSSRRRRRLDRAGPGDEPGSDEFLDEDHGPVVDHHIWYIRTVGLAPSVISKISIVKYKKGDGLIDGTECSVCLSEFRDDETLRLLPKCNHAFHIPCIDTWLRSHTNCPLCRAGILKTTSEEVVVHGPGLEEEARVGESGREIGNGSDDLEIRIGIEEDNESRAGIGFKINDDDGIEVQQPMRRSVSLDSLSASMINAAVADAFQGRNSDDQSDETKESDEVCSQTRSSSIKRSLSCSAKNNPNAARYWYEGEVHWEKIKVLFDENFIPNPNVWPTPQPYAGLENDDQDPMDNENQDPMENGDSEDH